ncbi:MAG: class I SAM-dependent methyltransferase [bacterium]|nr:class I SAM-dependent methyltransferase [bacterium]
MEEVNCNLCEGKDTELLFYGKDWVFPTNEEFNIVRYKKCGLVFLNPRPEKDEILKYYPDEYYGKGKKKLNEPYPFLKPKRVKMTKKYIKCGKILDIGSQRGEFLLKMMEAGFEPYGVEMSEYACNYAKTLGLKNVIHGDIEEIKLESKFFNVVILWHVLEHIYDPQKLL